MSFHPIDLNLPEGVKWYDLCKHRQQQVLDMQRASQREPFLMGNTGRIPDLKCEECK